MCESIREHEVILRRLELLDAEPMLKWMLEPDIYRNMQYDPQEQNIEKCKDFIRQSWIDKENLHLAIANESGEYLGTVSLKNIDRKIEMQSLLLRYVLLRWEKEFQLWL